MTNHHLPARGTTAREEFSGHELVRTAETASTALAAREKAQVEAAYIMAMQRPRDLMVAREKLLNDCERRGFAEAAQYTIPRGGKQVRGPSIRFAEAAARALGNIRVQTAITYDDAERRVGEVTVTDLEANLPLSAGFTVDKTIERRKVKDGDVVVGERTNSQGQTVFRIIGTEADVQMKQESTVSRLRRNLILQLLPGDLRDEAIAQCEDTLHRQDASDPGAAAKRLADAFHKIGISAAQIREYLGHNIDQVTPDEASTLRGVFSALKDGETTWSEVIEARHAETKRPPSDEEKATRGGLVKRIAQLRVQDVERHDAALKAAGVAKGMSPAQLPTETLEKIAAWLDAPAPEETGGEAGGKDVDPEVKAWQDSLGGDPDSDEVEV